MKRDFLDVHGGKLYYEISGEGHPLVLLHAGIANLRMWDKQVEEFSEHYQVICYDARTFGKSTSEPIEFSNRQDLLDLLNHLKIEKTHLLGISRGGSIAMDFTLEFPDKVSSLSMVASHPSGFNYEEPETEKVYAAREEELSKKRDVEAMADLDVEIWVDGTQNMLLFLMWHIWSIWKNQKNLTKWYSSFFVSLIRCSHNKFQSTQCFCRVH
jgi:3-oxoadipate enol-lactonase